jgi:DNA polymerase III sliding clamp (beta) subunit (PCNA family)
MRIEIDSNAAVNLFKAVDKARAADPMRIALTGINWEIVGGVHIFTATDSYRLHTVSIPDSTATYSDSVLLSGDVVKAVQVCAKAGGKGGILTLERYDTFVKVSGFNNVGVTVTEMTVNLILNTEYPTCRSIIDGATLWAGKDSPITVESVHARKPSRIVSANDYGVFTGVVMPQRGGK